MGTMKLSPISGKSNHTASSETVTKREANAIFCSKKAGSTPDILFACEGSASYLDENDPINALVVESRRVALDVYLLQ